MLLGVDVGGTNVRCAVAALDRPGLPLVHRSAPTPEVEGPAPLLDFIETLADVCLAEVGQPRSALAGVGCAVPGILDAGAGVVHAVANLRGWDDVPLAGLLRDRFDVPAAIENDVNAAALGEYRFGAGAGYRSLVYMTVSTGVAAGIVLDGQLWRGHHHAAGELAYLLPDPAHIGQDWEGIGCLELTSAGVGLARAWAAQNGGSPSPGRAVEVFDAARRGHAGAMALVRRAQDYLAQATVALATVLDPEVIVLGGSIVTHQAQVFDRIRSVVATTLPFPPEIRHASLGGDAPILGALSLAAEQVRAA